MTDQALYAVQVARADLDEAEEAVAAARTILAENIKRALTTHTRDEVAEAARMTPAGMYKALARVYGQRRPSPRRNPRPAGIDI